MLEELNASHGGERPSRQGFRGPKVKKVSAPKIKSTWEGEYEERKESGRRTSRLRVSAVKEMPQGNRKAPKGRVKRRETEEVNVRLTSKEYC